MIVLIAVLKVYVLQGGQLFAQVCLGDAALALAVMTLEQVCDFFSRYGQVLAVARFKERKVVMQGTEALHFFVNGPVQVCQVDLRDLILALQFQVVLQPDDVFEELSEFLPSRFTET